MNYTVETLSTQTKVLTDAAGRKLLLYHGENRPDAPGVDLSVRVPVRRAVACSPVHLAFALRLQKESSMPILDSFIGILNAAEAHLVLPELEERLSSGKLKDIQHLHELSHIKPEVVFAFLFPHDEPYLYNLLAKIGTPNAVADAWYEPDIVERAKWLKFFALFFDLEKEAEGVVQKISEDIESTIRNSNARGKRVLWFTDFQGYAFVTGGRSWVAESVRRLGGEVITPEPTALGSAESSRSWIGQRMSDADAIVFTMVRPSILHMSAMYPMIRNSPAYKEGRIHGFNVNYWQEGTYAPEKWFRELSLILTGNVQAGREVLQLFSTVTT